MKQLVNSLAESLSVKTQYLHEVDRNKVIQAYHFAFLAHEGQYRRSGEPYITHPVSVALILADMQMDTQTLMSALLHDVIEDCKKNKEELAQLFSSDVAEIVDGVSKISAMTFETTAQAQAENYRKMLLAMTKDVRVILVKLADRLHNMRTLGILNPHKRRRIATETLDIFAPIANRLGMNVFRMELENLGFQALHPFRSESIKRAVERNKEDKLDYLRRLEEAFNSKFEKMRIAARVFVREKHLHSIYQKMKTQKKLFREITDIYGFQIVVCTLDDCYRVLGAVHNLYTPIPGRFKDFIAIPKANGYQSLHTTLKSFDGYPLEIQIRTEDMESRANFGIASHWIYKSDIDLRESLEAKNRTHAWLKGLLEIQKNTGSSLEFIENVKSDLFPRELYAFTPKGKIVELTTGATPVDFAFAVHTDIGRTCIAARIDNRLSPLSTPLQTGQTVEIITLPAALPSPSWLNFVVTGKARSSIRNFLKNQKRQESLQLGRSLLDKAMLSVNTSLDHFDPRKLVLFLQEINCTSLDELAEEIGLGNRMAVLVARRLKEYCAQQNDLPEKEQHKPLLIKGTEGLVVNFAKCCYPIPGDPIVGFLSEGRGIIIHVNICQNMDAELRENPDQCINLSWHNAPHGFFLAFLRLELENKRGVLAIIASVLSDEESNIEMIDMEEKDERLSVMDLKITVKDRAHLSRILRKLRSKKIVYRITRMKGHASKTH